jgi:hypothetical protein
MTLVSVVRNIWLQFGALLFFCWMAYWFWTYDSDRQMITCAAMNPNDAASVCDPIGPAGLIVGILSAILLFVVGTTMILVMAVRRRRRACLLLQDAQSL